MTEHQYMCQYFDEFEDFLNTYVGIDIPLVGVNSDEILVGDVLTGEFKDYLFNFWLKQEYSEEIYQQYKI